MELSQKCATRFLLTIMLIFSSVSKANTDSIYSGAVNHPDRTKTDFKYDEKRKPLEVLPFTEIAAGDKVLELGAGGGYTTELLSWTVAESGKVYAHFLYNKDRIKDNRLGNVVALREHSLNEHAMVLEENGVSDGQLDAIVIFFVLHDIYLNNEMSPELLQSLRNALKTGGSLIILDNAAKPGSGLANIGDLHRIDEKFVISELENAGFELAAQSTALRNSADNHDKPWGDFEGLQDRFALRFVKK